MAGDEGALADIAQDVLAKIQRRNKLSLGFKEIIEDYQRVLRQLKEQAVRISATELSSRIGDSRGMASPAPCFISWDSGTYLFAMIDSLLVSKHNVSGSMRRARGGPGL